ncbi:MAG: VWA domain-containing protein [Pseudomonadota bacterium]
MAEDDLDEMRRLLAGSPPPAPREGAAQAARLAALEAFDAATALAANPVEARQSAADEKTLEEVQVSAAEPRRRGMVQRPAVEVIGGGLIRRLAMTLKALSTRSLVLGGVSVAVLALALALPRDEAPILQPTGGGGILGLYSNSAGDTAGAPTEGADAEIALAFKPPVAPAPAPPELRGRPLPESLNRSLQHSPQGRGGQAATPMIALPHLDVESASGIRPPVGEPLPKPRFEAEGRDRFEEIEINPVKVVTEDPVSTFSIDVDTASYGFVRRSLMAGRLPPSDAVRVEELINYFPFDYPAPETRETPFNADIEVIETPWNAGTQLMRVGIRGYSLEAEERPRANLVLLVDTSGSMNAPDKLPLLRNAFRLLIGSLSPEDTVSIVAYAGSAGTVLEPTPVSEGATILNALDRLQAGGSTAGGEGIRLAYQLAEQSFVEGGVNRVMLATDGDFNVGITDPAQLQDFIEDKRETGVYLSVLGFGQGNLNDALMQRLAQNGNGQAAHIDTLAEARKALVEEATSTLFPIAEDVKIQVEFNPAQIAEYRLIGYETRALRREDFDNDVVDAGEIGAGHRVTALYEITPVGSEARRIGDLRYGADEGTETAAAANDEMSDELAFLKIRYKAPGGEESQLISRPVTADDVAETPGSETRFAAAVAGFGQLLGDDRYLGDFGYDDVIELARGARGEDRFGYRSAFLSLVGLAKSLDTTAPDGE